MSARRTEYARRKGYASAASSKQRGLRKPPSTKNRIRSLQRLLKKAQCEEQKEALREQLKQLDKKMKTNRQKELERKYATRYHKIKFFERQKVRRRLRSVTKELARVEGKKKGDSDSVEEQDALLERKRKLEEDLAYIDYYPKGVKYYSLFGRSQGVDDPKTEQLRQEMRVRALRSCEDAKVAAQNTAAMAKEEEMKKPASDEGSARRASEADEDEAEDESEEPDEEDEEADDEIDTEDEEDDEEEDEDDDKKDARVQEEDGFFLKARTK
mmetsp:Transcript_11002/g.41085  ORF Transcript_11002/g.41085 Transcript_11002/m.41085 type:complete len:270 (-) Transcript_11002:349-1158(-)